MHQIAQLLSGHLLGERGVARDIPEQTSAVDHLTALLEIDDVSRQLIADLIGHVVGQSPSQMPPLSVGLDVTPRRSADECQGRLCEQRDDDRIPGTVRGETVMSPK